MLRRLRLLLILFMLCSASHAQLQKYWVYFLDKGSSVPSSGPITGNPALYHRAESEISPAARARRLRSLPPELIIGAEDLPVDRAYLVGVTGIGGIVIHTSRWFNAASVLLTTQQVPLVAGLPFVRRVVPVKIFRGYPKERKVPPANRAAFAVASLDYGPSAAQIETINVRHLHDLGIYGSNAIVGMLDTGFRWRFHESLNTRRVIAEYDFINHDDTTANQAGDSRTQDEHGTLTMSTLGGYMPGQLIGPAFGARFVLAKTEYVPTETQIEEDNWVAGIEWEESLGVDVVSSSLGYNDFDPQGPSPGDYTWANGDFNGRTTVSALAAVRASRLGVIVCDAMGNEGNGDGVVGTMLTPADADSILSVGAVTFANELADFSSTGPTNDGRTKPDIVAPGVGVYCASILGPSVYWYESGTSLATPLTAGSAALIRSARPELTPIQVRDALRNTARPVTDSVQFPSSPNNFTGWGLIDAFSAALLFGPIFSDEPKINIADTSTEISIACCSKFGIRPGNVILRFAVGASSRFDSLNMRLDSSMFFPTSGRYVVTVPPQLHGTLVRFNVEASDSDGRSYQSPAEVTGMVWQLNYGVSDVGMTDLYPRQYQLKQNYPNPFNPVTKIEYDLPKREYTTIKVYDLLGKLVATLVDGVRDPGHNFTVFDGHDLATGVYFYRIVTPSFVATKKMMLIR
jgi:hypothetical protein